MTTATSKSPASPKQQYLDTLDMEYGKTLRVLRAYPKGEGDLKPHAKSKSARELAFMFVAEQGLLMKALTTDLDWSQPPQLPKAPESLDAVIAAFEDGHRKLVDIVQAIPEDKLLSETVRFPTAPGKLGDIPKMPFLWMLLSDQIHHRGQFSVYLRMAGGKVPSIYGPSLDEPWM